MTKKIMFVDDEHNVLKSLRWVFADEPWAFHGFTNPIEALQALGSQKFAVVVADQRMKEMTGTAFLEQVSRTHPDTVRIIATAYADMEVTIDAINRGNVYRFLFKPWDERELKQTIRNAVAHHDLVTENRRLLDLLQNQNAKLKTINQRLEKTVALRTKKIEQKEAERRALESQLIKVQKMEAIGTFAGGIAHDFNNILSAIMGYTELAKMSVSDNQRAMAYLAQLEKAQIRAKELVRQILSFSRQNPSGLVPLRLNTIIDETLKLLRSIMPATITIEKKISRCGAVEASETQVHQVMMNLCTNAFHAMETDGGTLTIALSEVAIDPDLDSENAGLDPGKYARLVVSDTGQGIDSRIMDKIFDPYFTTKIKGKGTGLGLSVAHGIMTHLGGRIQVKSVMDQGTVFSVFFPLMRGTSKAPDVAETPAYGGSEHILFIDDEPSLVDIGKEILGQLGYEVTALTDSRDALDLFRNHPDRYDLVITDMTMPRMTGDKLAKAIMAVRAEVPVIICTGFSEKISEEKAVDMGIRAYAMKPLVRNSLAKTIRQVLDSPPPAVPDHR